MGYNIGAWGGFEAKHSDDGSPCVEATKSGRVWLDGRECQMDEARSGGIVVVIAPALEFRDDDAGYLKWLAAHPFGYVVNIARGYTLSAARVHHASCPTISGKPSSGVVWTGPYVKVCADEFSGLARWAIKKLGSPVKPCGICRRTEPKTPVPVTRRTELVPAPSLSDSHYAIYGPTEGSSVVQAWAHDYIRFENLPQWQKILRTEIRSRCRQLEPSTGQVLHASYFGSKLANADVENLVLYYIDSFKVAGGNGIRFEHGAAVPQSPDGAEYPFCYRYALALRTGAFADWRPVRTLASFDWTDLGAFAGEKKLAQTWLALARGRDQGIVTVCEPAEQATTFAVRLQVRPPLGKRPVWGGLVKGMFDGVICAFQAHTDSTDLPEVVARLSKYLPADPAEIESHLLLRRFAVLGAVPRLVSPYQADVKWDPADNFCVAGEVLATEPVGPSWSVKGDVIEVSRAAIH